MDYFGLTRRFSGRRDKADDDQGIAERDKARLSMTRRSDASVDLSEELNGWTLLTTVPATTQVNDRACFQSRTYSIPLPESVECGLDRGRSIQSYLFGIIDPG